MSAHGQAQRTVVGDLAREILERFPKAPTHQLARMLHRREPAVFRTVEQARKAVNYYRGANGAKNRAHAARTRVVQAVRSADEAEAARQHRHRLPASDATEWLPWILPSGVRSVAVFADLHLPYHDRHAIQKAVRQAKERRPDVILINGDLVDSHHLSRFQKDPRRRSFPKELAMGREFWLWLHDQFPKAEKKWKLGNHEEHYWRYLSQQAPALCGMQEFEPETVFGLRAPGVELILDKRIILCGKLPVIHGHEYPQAVLSPVNAARGYFLRAKSSVLGAHAHQHSEHWEPDIKGRELGAWSMGCLCDLHPEYARLNRWAHGWAHIQIASDGTYEVDNVALRRG
jgi:predicted phosphodiesterase